MICPSGSAGKESACSIGDTGDPGSILGQENLEKEMVTHSSILESMGSQRADPTRQLSQYILRCQEG